MNDPTSILVFRNGSIGNTLMAVPALRALRSSFPNATISAVVDSLGRELLEHCPYIDELLIYDKHAQDAGLAGFIRIAKAARKVKPSHAVLFKRFFRNGLISYLSGAKVRAGFMTGGKAPFLNLTTPYDLLTHIAHLNLRLVELIGAKSQGDHLEVFLSPADHEQAEACRSRLNLQSGGYICAHYGGVSVGSDFMPLEVFAEFLNRLRENRSVVLIGSGAAELEAAQALLNSVPNSHSGIDLPLRTTIALLGGATAFVGFNSGPAHLAAACKLPGLVIFPDDVFRKDGVRWRPLWDTLRIYPARREMPREEWHDWISKAPPLIP